MRAIVWHWFDLRTEWNPALSAAAKDYSTLIPLYIYQPHLEKLGEASLFWLDESLQSLSQEYKKLGAHLQVTKGKALPLILKAKPTAVYWNHTFVPKLFQEQQRVKKALEREGIAVHTYNGNYLIDPRDHFTKTGKPYSVFAPFTKSIQISPTPRPQQPRKLSTPPAKKPPTFGPKEAWTKKLHAHWTPNRQSATKALQSFASNKCKTYETTRDLPGQVGTSRLSPYLHFGQLSPHEVWRACAKAPAYTRQLLWREFSTYFLYHYPHIEKENWNKAFDRFPWVKKPTLLRKWQNGQTGYPIIDAGMRELWETGWMHNRVRMLVASFLTKDLLIDWRNGEKWFWDTLVDADKANNVMGWQWVAGSGPDAAPYFRIFNPTLQGEKFDPEGSYIRKYIPELAKLSNKWINRPFEAPPEILKKAGIILGKTYPKPLVNHQTARGRALKAYAFCLGKKRARN